MASVKPTCPSDGSIDRTIRRSEKGLTMLFYPTCVAKRYDMDPTYITVEERDRRFMNELAAYQRFEELRCPFVPRLLHFSLEDHCLSISRIYGRDLLALSQSQAIHLPIKSILSQIDQMNDWLRAHGFCDMENNLKDMILDEFGRLYLVDFEPYSPGEDSRGKYQGMKPDIYSAAIDDLLQRVFIRRTRKATLTPQFIHLSLSILSRRPLKTVAFAWRYLVLGLRCMARQAFSSGRR
jgi:hypothetical protein